MIHEKYIPVLSFWKNIKKKKFSAEEGVISALYPSTTLHTSSFLYSVIYKSAPSIPRHANTTVSVTLKIKETSTPLC